MRLTINVDGKIFYKESDFTKYMVKNKRYNEKVKCKKGYYSYMVYVYRERGKNKVHYRML